MLPTRIDEQIEQTEVLQRGGLRVARAIHNAVLSGGDVARSLADLLHGRPLGHPLHPILITIPIGAWTLAAICDLVSVLTDAPDAEQAASALIKTGLVAAVPTALTGATDYSTIPEHAAATGAVHAILNSTAAVLYLASLAQRRAGRRGAGVGLATLAYALVGVSGSLGGELVYRHRVGVNHNAPAAQPAEWSPAIALSNLPDREPQRVEIKGASVLVYRDGGQITAIGAVCSHAGGPLEEGEVRGGCVRCPWHDSVFDLSNGAVVHGPATIPQPRYETRVQDGVVEVRAVKH
ncbi:MAG: hypothetical protein OHK0022_36090 [Roseiflexaceae bacterium]